MITEIVEANPLLVEYCKKVEESIYLSRISIEDFSKNDEWHYVQSDLNKNIFLLKRLDEKGLLSNNLDLCDCGIGFGTILYDLYLQSKEFNNTTFKFTGVEKYDTYIDSFNTNLKSYWNDELNIVHDDVMNHDYSNHNFIWFYSPFKQSNQMMAFIDKVITEAPVDGMIFGLDTFRVMEYGSEDLKNKFKLLKMVDLDGLYLFIK